jgi:excisionase family DNA binding protein
MGQDSEVIYDISHITGIGSPVFNETVVLAPTDGMLTEEQAAERAGVSRKQIRKLINAHRLEATDYGTGKRHHYRIKPEALAAMQGRAVEPQPAPRQRRSRVTAPPSRRSIFPRV